LTTANVERISAGHLSHWFRPMLDDGVLDAETVARPAARSPDTKVAIKYLIASGATAISIVEIDGACTFHVGSKILPDAAAIFWITATQAKPIVRQARKLAGRTPDIDVAEAALALAAADQRVTLTPHHVAVTRAGAAAERLDAHIESLRARGAVKEFTRAYRRRRLAAAANGEGFMSFATAELRLRRALVPLLVNGHALGPMGSLFADIFENAQLPRCRCGHKK
jgi:hypothetical protein